MSSGCLKNNNDLTIRQLQEEMQIGRTKAYDLIKSKKLSVYYVGTGVRVRRESVDAYKDSYRKPQKKNIS